MSWKVYDSNSTNIHQYDSPPSNLSHSAPSALFGHPAANVNDWYIVKEFSYLTGIPNGALNPAHGFPFHAPPNPPAYHSRGPSIIISACVTICLVLAITTLRLSLRYFRRDLRIGYDDFAIIPAALGVCVWLALQITMVGIAGDGKHMYDITYMNMSNFAKVSNIHSTPRAITSVYKANLSLIIAVGVRIRNDLFHHGRPDKNLHHPIQPTPDRSHLPEMDDCPQHISCPPWRIHHKRHLRRHLHLPAIRRFRLNQCRSPKSTTEVYQSKHIRHSAQRPPQCF